MFFPASLGAWLWPRRRPSNSEPELEVNLYGLFVREDENGKWLIEGDVIRREGRVIARL
jgi:hypothetical protein